MADARIQITAETAQAQASLRTLGDSVTGLSRKFLDMSSLAGTLGGALSISAFASFIKKTNDGVDALNDLHDATGASIEMLSGLEDRAARTGTSMDTVGTALVKLNKALEDAKPGSPQAQALAAIGLSAEKLKAMDPAEALRQTAVALAGFAEDGNKARVVQELFGKSMREVAPLLKDLAEGGELVTKVTTEQAQAAEDFNKQLFQLEKNAKDASRALVSDLVTGLNAAAKAFHESGLVAGIQTLLTGDDQYKNNKAIVENTEKLLNLENALLAAKAEGYAEDSKVIQNIKAQLELTKQTLATSQAYGKVLENGPTGEAPAPAAPRKSVGALPDQEALKKAAAEAERLRKLDLDGWVKYADAVLAEGERVDEIARKQVEDVNDAQKAKVKAVLDSFAGSNKTLAEAMGQAEDIQLRSLERRRAAELVALDAQRKAMQDNGTLTIQAQEQLAAARQQIEERYAAGSIEGLARRHAAELAALDAQRQALQAQGNWTLQAQQQYATARQQIEDNYVKTAAQSTEYLRATEIAALQARRKAAMEQGELTVQAQQQYATELQQIEERYSSTAVERITRRRAAELAALDAQRQAAVDQGAWSLQQQADYERQRLDVKAKADVDFLAVSAQTVAEAVAQQQISDQDRITQQRDMEFARLEEQRQILLDNNAWTLDTEAQYEQARINAKARADAAFIKLDKQTALQRQQVLVGALATISSLMSNSNVTLFRIGQAASIANATISTIEGATKALALGPIIGPPLAAMIYAAGIANVAQIAGTEIGGGTPSPVNATFSGGSVATGTTPTPITALPAPNAGFEPARQQINLTLVGKNMDFDTMVNEFIPLLQQASANGALDIQVTRG